MSRPNFINSNVVYHDNSKEYNIDARGKDLASILRACEAEDIQPEEVKPEPAPKPQGTDLPFLVPEKLEELGLYTIEEFADKYRQAAESDANEFAAFLKHYRDLKVFDFKKYSKKKIFSDLRDFFPTMRQYSYDNFVAYF